MSAKTTQLISSGEFCKLRYDTIPVHLQTFLSITITQKCQILSCDTLVANERSVATGVTASNSADKSPGTSMDDSITLSLKSL
jgi:hypothetical protein